MVFCFQRLEDKIQFRQQETFEILLASEAGTAEEGTSGWNKEDIKEVDANNLLREEKSVGGSVVACIS